MTPTRSIWALLLALAATTLAACGSTGGSRGAAGRGAASRSTAAPALPPGWGRMEPLLRAGERAQADGDTAALLRLSPDLEREGLVLLKSNMPNTLARHDVPRFLEARQAFGDALVALANARASGQIADLGPYVLRVADAFHGWMGVIRGGPPERSL